jgi:hypothetical protein
MGMSTFATSVHGTSQSYFKNGVAISRLKETHITIFFDKPQITRIDHYQRLELENCSYITTPHHPMLPVKSLTIKLPERSTVTNVRVEAEEVPLEGNFSILPAPSPTTSDSSDLGEISEDQTIYTDCNPFPKDRYTYREFHGIDVETSTRVKYVAINLFPLRYFPIQSQVTWTRQISVTISYSELPEILAPTVTLGTRLKNLIITSPTLEPYAVELAGWKNDTGIPSKVLTTTWIYANYSGTDNQEKIRNCIKDAVTTYGITYVTIFGDADQVPIRYVYVPDGHDTYTPTDLYYADLDGTWDDNHDGLYADQRYDNVDGVPDVYIGRIPPSLPAYARVAVDKIEGYQKSFDASEDWTRRIILAAGTCSGDGFSDNDKNGTTILQEYIANIVKDKNQVKLYQSAGNLSTANMASEVNKGALFLSFAGHGDPGSGFFSAGWLFSWVIPGLWWNGFGISDVQSLTNGYKLPVVTTMSCSTARFDDTDCLGEWFVLEPHGGSIGYFGATRVAYGYFNEWAPYGFMGEMERRIYENLYNGSTRLGQMWGTSISQYVQSNIWNYTYANNIDVKTFMEFVLLGDPTLNVGQEFEKATIYQETVHDKPQFGGSWSVVDDSSSYSGLVMRASSASPNGGCLFGPYITTDWNEKSMAGKPYTVNFRLKVSNNLPLSDVVSVDVCFNAGAILQSVKVKANDFASSNTWQDFQLNFIAPSTLSAGLEFRVINLNNGVADIFVDRVIVEPDLSVVYLEDARNKPQSGSSWSKVSDSSSLSGTVMKASALSLNGATLYGPYITAGLNEPIMLGKPYVATFRLKVSSNLQTNYVVYLDVCYNQGSVIQSKVIAASDFAGSNMWQDFQLTFVVPNKLTQGLEFRVVNLNQGFADIFIDKIAIRRGWEASAVFVESGFNKFQSGASWVKVQDSSSYSGLVMRASSASPNGDWLFGPYITTEWDGGSMFGKSYTVTFRLKASSNLFANELVCVDIAYNAGSVLKSLRLKANDFRSPNVWQDFNLTFTVPSSLTYGLEFRLQNLNNGVTDMYADKITIFMP